MSFESRVNALGSGLQTAKVRLEDARARHGSAGHRPVLKALQGVFGGNAASKFYFKDLVIVLQSL